MRIKSALCYFRLLFDGAGALKPKIVRLARVDPRCAFYPLGYKKAKVRPVLLYIGPRQGDTVLRVVHTFLIILSLSNQYAQETT